MILFWYEHGRGFANISYYNNHQFLVLEKIPLYSSIVTNTIQNDVLERIMIVGYLQYACVLHVSNDCEQSKPISLMVFELSPLSKLAGA